MLPRKRLVRLLRHTRIGEIDDRTFTSMRGTLGGAVMAVAGPVITVAGDARGLLLSVVGVGLM